jgi:hypothetical protein
VKWLTGDYSEEQLRQPIAEDEVTKVQALLSEPARIIRNIGRLQDEGFLITPLIVSDLATALSLGGIQGVDHEDYEFFIHRTVVLLGVGLLGPLSGWEGSEPMDFAYAASWVHSQLTAPMMGGLGPTHTGPLRLVLWLYSTSYIAATEYSVPLEDLMEAMFLQSGTINELIPEGGELLDDSGRQALQRLQILPEVAIALRESFDEHQKVNVDDIRHRFYVRLESRQEEAELSGDEVDETILKVANLLQRSAGLEEGEMPRRKTRDRGQVKEAIGPDMSHVPGLVSQPFAAGLEEGEVPGRETRDKGQVEETMGPDMSHVPGLVSQPFAAGLEESRPGLEAERIQRIHLREQLQTMLSELTEFGFTHQILDQALLAQFPEFAVLAQLHPDRILIDRSESQDQTFRFIMDNLVPSGVYRVGYYPGENSERAGWFVNTAEGMQFRVDIPEPGEMEFLLAQLLANLSGHPNDTDWLDRRLEGMGLTLQQVANWLSNLA